MTTLENQLLEALELIYHKYENGDGCYEDPEHYDGYVGSAVRLSGEEEDQILKAFEAAGVPTALSASRRTPPVSEEAEV